MSAIARVWIEEGCIVCHACEGVAPTVFRCADDTTVIRAATREDGVESMNLVERSRLLAVLAVEHADDIAEAAAGCPCDVIRFETL